MTDDAHLRTESSSSQSGGVKPQPFRSFSQFLAFGFGSGLTPKAPGTAGTVVAVPLYLAFAHWDWPAYTLVVILAAVLGVWICELASRELKVHDHPGIVWDEFVGYWVTMWALPVEPLWIIAGFVVFRVFDIAKPWPVGMVDRRVHGGLGIMVDDILAGIMACATLHLANALV